MHFLVLSVCLAFVSSTLAVDQCQFFPGEVKFSYEETQDESQWYGKYGGNFGTYQYRRKVSVYGNGVIQQQQQVVSFPNVPPAPNVPNAPNEPGVHTTTPAPQKPLPIWRLVLPRNAKTARATPVENGAVGGPSFELTDAEFDHENLTKYGEATYYTKSVDVTQQDIRENKWYLVCINVSVVIDGQQRFCSHCSLIKACVAGAYACNDKAVSLVLLTSMYTRDNATIVYNARDLPLKSAVVKTKVYVEPEDRRCSISAHSEPIAARQNLIYPDTATYVKIDKLDFKQKYSVTTDLRIVLDNKKEEIVLFDYLHDESDVIPKCTDEKYNRH